MTRDVTQVALLAAKAGPTPAADEAQTEVVTQCKLVTLLAKATSSAAAADSKVDAVIALAAEVPWYPKGYEPTSQDDNVALQFLEGAAVHCDAFTGCFQANVIVNEDCSTLYIELATETSDGTKVGYTNDILSGLSKGDKGLMTFDVTSDGTAKGEVTEVECE